MNLHKYSKNKMIKIDCQTFSTESTRTEEAQNHKSWSHMKYFIQNENNKTSHGISCMIYIYNSTHELELKLYKHEYMTKVEFHK